MATRRGVHCQYGAGDNKSVFALYCEVHHIRLLCPPQCPPRSNKLGIGIRFTPIFNFENVLVSVYFNPQSRRRRRNRRWGKGGVCFAFFGLSTYVPPFALPTHTHSENIPAGSWRRFGEKADSCKEYFQIAEPRTFRSSCC